MSSVCKELEGRNLDRVKSIFREHGEFIFRTIVFHMQDSHDAEDVFQELFLRLLINTPEDLEHLKSYLYRAATNDCIDFVRRKCRYQARIRKINEVVPEHHHDCDPGKRLMVTEEAEKMLGLIDRHLPTHLAEPIKKRFLEQHSNREIAADTGVEHKSISRYVSVGLAKLRDLLGAE